MFGIEDNHFFNLCLLKNEIPDKLMLLDSFLLFYLGFFRQSKDILITLHSVSLIKRIDLLPTL